MLSVCSCVQFLVSLCYQEYKYIHRVEFTVLIVFPTLPIRMYRSSSLVPLGSCLTAAACPLLQDFIKLALGGEASDMSRDTIVPHVMN